MSVVSRIMASRTVALRGLRANQSWEYRERRLAGHERRVRDALASYPPEIAGPIIDQETRDIGAKLGLVA